MRNNKQFINIFLFLIYVENVQFSLPLFDTEKINNVFKVFDDSVKPKSSITLAYSGGKDSTLLTILFFEWLRSRPDISLKINIMHNDTMSEIDPMEDWARSFILSFKQNVEKFTGSTVEVQIKTPKPIDTFYWRAIIRGYPAPSFNFRWCVHLLKEKPAKLDSVQGRLFTGLRDAESSTRSGLMKKKYGQSCGASPGGCMAFYYSSQGNGNKVAPFRDWTDGDVWQFLFTYKKNGFFDISPLFNLYANPKVRYGCWHCTLASVQMGLHSLDDGLAYFEAVRVLYRKFSDIHYLRNKKNTGYSKLGPLNATGRSILLNLVIIAEQLSGFRLYGLDRTMIDGDSLRKLLFELPPKEATQKIKKADPRLPDYRYVPISRIRSISTNRSTVIRAIRDVKVHYQKEKAFKLLKESGRDPFETILEVLKKEAKNK